MRRGCSVLLLGAAAWLAVAPASAARKDMEILQSDVDELQRQVYDLKRLVEAQNEDLAKLVSAMGGSDARRELAAFNQNVEELRGDIRALATRFDDTSTRLGAVERRLSELRGGAPPDSGPAALPPPGASTLDRGGPEESHSPPAGGTESSAAAGDAGASLFQQAYADYLKDGFDLAVSEFRDYLRQYPTSDLADNAQYWIAMSAFNQEKYDDAVRELDQLLGVYPKSENAPAALYRKGLALLELNRLGQAVLVFNDVVSKYPGTPAASQAQSRLQELASGER